MSSKDVLERKCIENLSESELVSILEESLKSYDGTNGIPVEDAFRVVRSLISTH